MGNTTGTSRAFLLLVLAVLLAVSCARTDATWKRFDIPAQPAGVALNEFARQADITLIFSYDLVADDRTHVLKGRYTVDHGLTRLLEGTGLSYRQAADGTYLICPRDACDPGSGMPEEAFSLDRETSMVRMAEMHLRPVSMIEPVTLPES